MVKARPQLSRDELLRLKWFLGSVLALLSAWTVFFMEIESLLLVVAVTTMAVAAIVRPAWPALVPAWVHRLAFPAILAAFAYDLYALREPLPALIRLDLLLILYRVMTHRRRREDLQLIVLGLFLIVIAGVLTVSLAFALQILAFTACALLFLFVITLADADAGGAAAPPIPTGIPPSWTRGRWRDLFRRIGEATDWRLAALAALLFVGVVLLSGLLFLSIPRFELQNGLFLDRLISRKTYTGFSDTIRFGEVTSIIQDNSLALSVDDLGDRNALPAIPYWRMVVLDEYTGAGFRQSAALRRELEEPRTRNTDLGTRTADGGGAALTIYLEPGVSRYLPLLGGYHRLRFTEPQTFTSHDDLRMVALQRDPPKMLAYRVENMDASSVLPDPEYRRNAASGRRYLDLPLSENDGAAVAGWVETLRPADADAGAAGFATHAAQWLERRHTYSLESTLPPGSGDLLVRWIGSETPGHCEYFAGAMVLLARTAGYPARLLVGFKGGTWNPYSNSFAVRGANAHAWCEIFDDQTGAWHRVDPTPGGEAAARIAEEARAAGREAALFATGWAARLEALRIFWYRRIVNFDRGSQVELAATAKQAMRSLGERLREALRERAAAMARWFDRPWGAERAIVGAALLALAAAIASLWRMFGRSWWLRWRSAHARAGDDPVRREASRWLHRAHAATRRGIDPPKELFEALVRLRYGDTRTWPDPAPVFRAARRACRR